MVVGRRIWAKGKPNLVCGFSEFIENDAGLNARPLLLFVDLDNLIHVLAEVHHHGNVATLARKACASAPGKNRGTKLAAQRYGLNDIFGVTWNDNTDRNLPVVRAIGCVKCSRAIVEAHFTVDAAL